MWYNTDPAPEPFPPGTRVNILVNGIHKRSTIQNVPLPIPSVLKTNTVVTPNSTIEQDKVPNTYTILLDDNTTHKVSCQDLLTPSTTMTVDTTAPSTVWAGIPSHSLHQNAKITLEHDGTYHKGYLTYSPDVVSNLLSAVIFARRRLIFPSPYPTSPIIGCLSSLTKPYFLATQQSPHSFHVNPITTLHQLTMSQPNNSLTHVHPPYTRLFIHPNPIAILGLHCMKKRKGGSNN